MNIFSEVKEYLTARQVAENYGLQVRRNGLACCPFHDDKHPSMKIDKNYHCFACGVGGDAIDYVSRMFDLSQYEAALKIVEDFRLPIEVKHCIKKWSWRYSCNGKVEFCTYTKNKRYNLEWRL